MTLKEQFLLTTKWSMYYDLYRVTWLESIQDRTTNAHCEIGRTVDNTLVVSFRGTQNWKDILADCMAFKMVVPYNNVNPLVKVHAGFLAYYMVLRDKVLKYARDYKKIIVLGHSLGGAMATLCCVDIQYNFPDTDIEGIVFGSPRVGNTRFKKSFLGRVKKFSNVQMKYDIVPHVPFYLWGYRTIAQSLIVIQEKHNPFDIVYNHLAYDRWL